ncbi:methyl-accepting chemotaxis protein [Rhizobium halophytocola]|uniref:Methyl-accepting chemotaxis protein n=1 Tax=Rhizobium halophytocola TaxID=735519 RepID=A0ABS4DZT3_9HYPH|nr:methyl-accepting chemotaxis protein [Rhizobium halophytocola]MBP1851198.1 methyl-accepting chemotaxis protein [Rhizobium halophytocola]
MKNFRLAARLYGLVGIALVVLVAGLGASLMMSYDSLLTERRATLASIDDNAMSILDKYYKLEQDGTLTREEAQTQAMAIIGALRYKPDGYLWINDMTPRMVMHPIKPALIGKDLTDMADPNGKHLFVEFVNVVKAQGEGFVDYYWPKPGFDAPVAKQSHVIGFKPWGWIVGTGLYSDDLEALFLQKAKLSLIFICVAMVLIAGCAYAIVGSITKPVNRLKTAMNEIANENVETDIIDTDRKDEIGGMAAALAILRETVRERLALRGREAEQQKALDGERQSNENRLRSASDRQSAAMGQLGTALERLANGDLTVVLDDLGPDYEKIHHDFNGAVNALNGVLGAISETSEVVSVNADGISEATGNLSRRTEQQAASLEETAAALDEITATVRTSTERVNEARHVVGETRASASRSGEVVREAVDAMGRIEESSQQINQIISVIDEIAFQTNLLALNAGVEAARAGEAGRGFAVVAQEVRELAQRSANAAKEIKQLITASAEQVGSGVKLVRSTGEALVEIEKLVDQVNEHVNSIATASKEQSTGLQEINATVNNMDQVTQQNAAMVEETTASSQTLAQEAMRLRDLLAKLQLAGTARQARRHAA